MSFPAVISLAPASPGATSQHVLCMDSLLPGSGSLSSSIGQGEIHLHGRQDSQLPCRDLVCTSLPTGDQPSCRFHGQLLHSPRRPHICLHIRQEDAGVWREARLQVIAKLSSWGECLTASSLQMSPCHCSCDNCREMLPLALVICGSWAMASMLRAFGPCAS